MRDVKRIDKVLQILGDVWRDVPDWRLCQLFCNLQRAMGNDMFYIEDDRLIEILAIYKEELKGDK